jgi:hypothetical protein
MWSKVCNQSTAKDRTYRVAVVTSDFNGDGITDIAVANTGSSTLSLFLNDGKGSFSSGKSYNVGRDPRAMAVCDLNSDKLPDLVTVNYDDNTLRVLVGNGKGSFSTLPSVSVDIAPLAVVVADFNQDGKQDVATANSKSGTLSILMGDGRGGFSSNQALPSGGEPFSLVAQDVTNDSRVDLIAADPSSGDLKVFAGDGKGHFDAPLRYAAGKKPFALSSFGRDRTKTEIQFHFLVAKRNLPQSRFRDFNADGHDDLVVLNGETISMVPGKGDGSFREPKTFEKLEESLTSIFSEARRTSPRSIWKRVSLTGAYDFRPRETCR